jgi:PAS domain S-box-containing protein
MTTTNALSLIMTAQTIRKVRVAFGWAAMFGAILLTALTGYRAHMNTLRQTSMLSARQDVIDLSLDSDERYPLCIMDSAGKVVTWNRAMESLCGLSKSEAVNKGIGAMMCDPIKAAKHDTGLAAAFRDPHAHSTLTIINCRMRNVKTGEKIPVHVCVRIVEAGNGSGNLYAVARIDRDSTIQEFGTPSAERAPPK